MRLVDHHYDMSKVNIAFFVGGALLLATWVWAIWDDYAKPYKSYQRTFYQVYEQQLQSEQRDVMEGKKDELQEIEQQLRQARQRIGGKGSEISRLQERIKRLKEVRIPQADARMKAISADLTPVEYKFQRLRARAEDDPNFRVPDDLRRQYRQMKTKYDQAQEKLATLQENLGQLRTELANARERVDELESRRQSLVQQRNALQDEIQRISDRPINIIMELPLIDFINPWTKIQQFQVAGMYMDYNFDLVSRRDYCASCHMGINKPAFQLNEQGEFENENTRQAFQETFPNPDKRERMKAVFKAHPRLDLIGPSNSKYPFSKYGCTGCHWGDGRALDFNQAAHTPDNEKERKEWKEQYGWHKREFWEQPMLKSHYYEAAFDQFYPRGTHVDIPDAPRLNEARDLWRKNGCNGCHALEGMNYQRKIGFSLEHVGSKLQPGWVRRWIEKPRDFDPTTRMPQVFHKSNMQEPEDRERGTVIIDAITTYIYEQSQPIDLEDPPARRGDPRRGEQLVETLGCYGCHTMKEDGVMYANGVAPDLSYVGSKLNRRWLYNWLKNPTEIWPETHMPSMRLSDREANDITAYLMNQTKDDWDPDAFPKELMGDTPVEKLVDERLEPLALKFLGRTRGPQEARNQLQQIKNQAGDSEQARQRAVKKYLGSQAVDYWGCSSCHAIPGRRGPNRIGVELTQEANKGLHKFAFNLVHIPHTRQDFIFHKLKQPGIYDKGLTKGYLEKYRMPRYHFSDTEAHKLTMFVMAQRNHDHVEESYQFPPTAAQKVAYEGRKLVKSYNCQGCHTLDSEPAVADYWMDYYRQQLEQGNRGPLREILPNASAQQLAQAQMPPSLTNVGRRLTEDWLFQFLKQPLGPGGRSQIRTWQTIRMPQFHFTDSQASTIVQGLVSEGWNGPPPLISSESRTTTPEELRVGRALFNQVCANCHVVEGGPMYKMPQMTPNLGYIQDKFHYRGFVDWIERPTELFTPENPGLYRHAGMVPYPKLPINESTVGFEPSGDYSSKQKQMEALRDYIFYYQQAP